MRLILAGLCMVGAMACDKAPGPSPAATSSTAAPATATATETEKATATATAAPAATSTGYDDALIAGIGGKTIAGQILDSARRPAADVVVYLKESPGKKASEKPPAPPLMDQKDKAFRPRVMPVMVGTTVEFKNSDAVLHNVYSRAKVKSFDLGAFPSSETKTVTFDAPGRVDVFCAIHTNMHSIILVLETPHFAVTGGNGSFRIEHIPAGKHTIVIWDELNGEVEATVDVTDDKPGIVRRELTKR